MCLYEYISRETMIHSLLISRPLQSVLLVTLKGTRMGYETLPYSGHCAKTGNESSYNGINLVWSYLLYVEKFPRMQVGLIVLIPNLFLGLVLLQEKWREWYSDLSAPFHYIRRQLHNYIAIRKAATSSHDCERFSLPHRYIYTAVLVFPQFFPVNFLSAGEMTVVCHAVAVEVRRNRQRITNSSLPSPHQ